MNKLLQKAILSIGATTMMVGGTLAFNTDLANGIMQNLGVKTTKMQENNTKLEAQKTTLLEKVVSLDTSIKTLEGEKAELQRQLEEALANGNESSEEVANLQARIQELTTEIATLEGEKLTLETKIGELETQVGSLEQEKERLEGEVNEANTYLNDLKTQIDAIEVGSVEELPNLDQYGTTEGVTPPTNNDNVWDLNKTPQTITYKDITITRGMQDGEVMFNVSNLQGYTLTLYYQDRSGKPQTLEFTEGQNYVSNPPHTYNKIEVKQGQQLVGNITMINIKE